MPNLNGTAVYQAFVRELETTDPAHPDTWDPIHQVLINNDVYMKTSLLAEVGFGASVAGSFIPVTDNSPDIGSLAKRVRSIFAGTSLVVGINARIVGTPYMGVSGTSPGIYLDDTDSGADTKVWSLVANTDALSFSLHNDALSTSSTWLAVARVGIAATSVIFNPGQLDSDFVVRSDNNASALVVDAGNDRVGIGTATPSDLLDVYHGTTNSAISASSGRAISDGTTVGKLSFLATQQAAPILAVISGNAAGSTAGDRGGDIRFFTKSDGGSGTGGTRMIIGANNTIFPLTDNVVSMGVAANRWADVRSVLINGADYGMDNGWKMTESDKYEGYPKGWAVGCQGMSPDRVGPRDPKSDRPVFVATEEFIEFQGRRITPGMFDRLIAMAVASN